MQNDGHIYIYMHIHVYIHKETYTYMISLHGTLFANKFLSTSQCMTNKKGPHYCPVMDGWILFFFPAGFVAWCFDWRFNLAAECELCVVRVAFMVISYYSCFRTICNAFLHKSSMKFDSGYFDWTHVTYTPWRCNIERNYEAIDLG